MSLPFAEPRLSDVGISISAPAPRLPPGPTHRPVFQVLRWLRQPLEFLEECAERYGSCFTLRLAAAPPLVLFSHPEAVHEILTADPDRLQAGAANWALAPVLGQQSLLLLDGIRHQRTRRVMLPPFHGERIQACGTLMRAVVDRAIDGWPLRQPFSVHAAMQEIALDVILRTVFGDDAETAAPLRAAVLELLALLAKPFVRVAWRSADQKHATRWREIARVRGDLDALLCVRIAERRAAGSPPRDDMLALLLEARDEAHQPLPDDELCDELTTLIVAGHETTATALAWVFHYVLTQPALLARLRDESRAAAGDVPGAAPYREATIKETLRLKPVFAVVGRLLAQPTRIGGFELPAGVIAAPCIYLVHRRPDVWPAPEQFDPTRFLHARPTPYEYLPFGGGGRRCIGMAFALYEMMVVIGRVIMRTELRLAPGSPVRTVRRSITFAPSGGVPVVMVRRIGCS